MNGDRVTAFLYLLLRDGQQPTPGRLEELVTSLEAKDTFSFSNPFIATYAKELRDRLVGPDKQE